MSARDRNGGRAGTGSGALRLRDVAMSYDGRHARRAVIEGLNLELPAGRLTAILGPSGCGKSTLIRLMAGFERPTSGQITLDGRPVAGADRRRLVVFQETALFPWMSVAANAAYGPRARGVAAAVRRANVAALLQRVGLQHFADRYPAQLSGGMQRRAELARALANDPDVMILDEPFRGLDAMSHALMASYYAALFEETRRTQCFVTSDVDEAIFLADRLVVMSTAPMRVREVIEVDLPRPRRFADVFDLDRANEVKKRALSILREEAMKSFLRRG